jgi:hypothetical protein
VSCAVALETMNGFEAIAFPWTRETAGAMALLLMDGRVRKVGANIKFENNWLLSLGIKVRGWWWDVNLTAHAIYNGSKIRSITPVDFQATVSLGTDDWDSHVTPYLISTKKSGGYATNRITELDLGKLLRYNGLDALYELQICYHQRRLLGLEG